MAATTAVADSRRGGKKQVGTQTRSSIIPSNRAVDAHLVRSTTHVFNICLLGSARCATCLIAAICFVFLLHTQKHNLAVVNLRWAEKPNITCEGACHQPHPSLTSSSVRLRCSAHASPAMLLGRQVSNISPNRRYLGVCLYLQSYLYQVSMIRRRTDVNSST